MSFNFVIEAVKVFICYWKTFMRVETWNEEESTSNNFQRNQTNSKLLFWLNFSLHRKPTLNILQKGKVVTTWLRNTNFYTILYLSRFQLVYFIFADRFNWNEHFTSLCCFKTFYDQINKENSKTSCKRHWTSLNLFEHTLSIIVFT